MSEYDDDFPTTPKAIRLRLYALRERSKKHAEEAQQIAQEIADLAVGMVLTAEPGSGSLKRADGRLTEAGGKALDEAFENGMKVGEAAKCFGISPSAASVRKKIFLASKENSKN